MSEEAWLEALPAIRKSFERITEDDLRDCGRRIDLLTAKVQNRHWVDRVTARRMVLSVLGYEAGGKA